MGKYNFNEWVKVVTQMIHWLNGKQFPISEELLRHVYDDNHFNCKEAAIEYIWRTSNPST